MKELCEILLEIESKCASFRKWYNSSKKNLLFQLSIYFLVDKFKVILSLFISELSEVTPTNTIDKEDFRSFSSFKLRIYILDTTIYFFLLIILKKLV